ncbi:IS3 family transposase [Fructilactobacillus vespulae]|uniref:IS3 family transposase n=1 Tax=Fructilactobacillus vespulae TaxID=1249630 RepID=UPI0039B5A96C
MVIDDLRRKFKVSLSFILRAVKLPRSNYYYAISSHSINKDVNIIKLIKEIKENNPNYGYRRVTLALNNAGKNVNHKRVLRIMKKHNLLSSVFGKKRRRYNSYEGNVGKRFKNRLNRRFNTPIPFQKLASDTTELRYGNQSINERIYLNPVLDLFSGEIISYSVSDHPDFDSVFSPIKEAVLKLPKTKFKRFFHSDQGVHYQNKRLNKFLRKNRITQSMSRKATCLDNAVIESFFHILKIEIGNNFNTKEELINSVRNWIYYYNNYRIKTKLGGKSPIQYRKLVS